MLALPEFRLLRNVLFTGRGELSVDGHPHDPHDHGPGFPAAGWASHSRQERDARQRRSRFAAAARDGVRLTGRWLWITDRYSLGFSHWLIDHLARLEVYHAVAPMTVDGLLLPAATLRQSFVRPSLDAFPSMEIATDASGLGGVVEEMLVPIVTPGRYRQDPALINALSERIRRHAGAPQGVQRIHVDRSTARFRRLDGPGVEHLESRGFRSVQFEALPWPSQISLAAGANVLAGVHGAGLALMLAMPRASQIIELRQAAGQPPVFANLADACGHRYAAVICRSSQPRLHPHVADVVLDGAALGAALAETRADGPRRAPGAVRG